MTPLKIPADPSTKYEYNWVGPLTSKGVSGKIEIWFCASELLLVVKSQWGLSLISFRATEIPI